MQQQAAERGRVGEADARPARPGAAHPVDHSMTGAGETGEGRVDIRRLQRKMVQSGAATLDVTGDRALVASGVAGHASRRTFCAQVRMAGIERLQQLQLAVTYGEKAHPQSADRFRRPAVVRDPVLVGGEALDRLRDLEVGLDAFDRTAEPAGEDRFSGPVVLARYSDMVDPLHVIDRTITRTRADRLGQPGRDATGVTGSEQHLTATVQPRGRSVVGEAALHRHGGRVRCRDRNVMDAAPCRAAGQFVARLEQGNGTLSDGDPRDRAAWCGDLGARQPEIALEDRCDPLGVVDDHRDVGERRPACPGSCRASRTNPCFRHGSYPIRGFRSVAFVRWRSNPGEVPVVRALCVCRHPALRV